MKTVGRYRLAEPLSRTSGRAWLAYATDGSAVFVKELAPSLLGPDGLVEDLNAVALVLRSVDHTNVVGIRDCVVLDGSLFIVSDFVAGESLRTLEESGRMDAARAIAVISQVLEALAYLHRRGLVHGNVKPESVIVDADGTVRLTDFAGWAAAGGRSPMGSAHAYLGPEVARGEPLDQRSDIYSAGVVLYEALTGRLPLPETDGSPFPPPLGSPRLDLVLRRSLAEDPRFRYQTAGSFASELEQSGNGPDHAVRSISSMADPVEKPASAHAGSEGGIERDPTTFGLTESVSKLRRSMRCTKPTIRVLAGLVVLALAAVVGWQTSWPPGFFGGGGASRARTSTGSPEAASRAGANWTPTTISTGAYPSTGTASAQSPSELDPGAADEGLLSCPNSSFCVSIGEGAVAPSTPSGVFDVYASGTWSAEAAPIRDLNPPASSAPNTGLDAVSCPATGWCVAVGTYDDEAGAKQGLIETLANGSWSAETAPEGDRSGSMSRVTCSRVGSCVAIGEDGGSRATLWVLASGGWREMAAPTAGLSPPSGTRYPPRLADVSCTSGGSCAAVGAYYTTNGTELGLIEDLSSGAWSATTAPTVKPQGTKEYSLEDVSCPTPRFCVATGGSYDKLGYLHGLVETLSSGRWRSSEVAVGNLGLVASSPQWMYFTSLACASSGFCVATGWYFASASLGEVRSFLLTYANGTWTIRRSPVNGLSPAPGGLDVVPWATSCGAPGTCEVVGSYYDASGREYGLLETLSNGRWAAATAPTSGLDPVPGSDPGLELGAVSCPMGATCFAVGVYQDSAGNVQGVVEHADE